MQQQDQREQSFKPADNVLEKSRLLEAVLFTQAAPIEESDLQRYMPCTPLELAALLKQLERDYAQRGIVLQSSGTAWAFRTAGDLAVNLVLEPEAPKKLSRAATETLAIIAYHQPVTRAEIEEIRGVAVAKGTIDLLLELGWIKPGKRREVVGRPLEWMTSQAFLDHFDLPHINSLPKVAELRAAGLLTARSSLTSLTLCSQGEALSTQGLFDGEDLDQARGLLDKEQPA